MAPVTQLGLGLRKQGMRRGRFVDRMATCARDAFKRVCGMAYVCSRQGRRMTTQTRIEDLFRLQLGKGVDGRFASVSFYVCPSRAVAAFATGVLGGLLPTSDASEMRILVEFQPYIGMAGFTGRAADVIIFGFLLSSCDQREGKHKRQP